MTRDAPTGITVIIVGLGIAGLSAAIECHRQGHTLTLPNLGVGDIIGLSGNGLNVLSRWSPTEDSIVSRLAAVGSELSSVEVYSDAGECKHVIPFGADDPAQGLFLRRSDLVNEMYRHATVDLGLDLRFGVTVDEYWETETAAGVSINGKEKITGHCIIAADGLYSKARAIITGEEPLEDAAALLQTGGAIFRSNFDASEVANDPDARWVLEGTSEHDRHEIYFGRDVTVLVGTIGKGKYVWWNCPHRDASKATENWVQAASVDPVLAYIQDWPIARKLSAVISKTPQGKCFNHALVTRKPLGTWVSQQGRMILIGDAAHPFLPHTGQGANQSIEDAAVVAICLRLSSLAKGDSEGDGVPLALRAMEKLRHKRVSVIQQGSIEAQEVSLEADLDQNASSDRFNAIARPAWIHCYDCVSHTHEEFDRVVDAVRKGTEYIPTNVPVDGKFHAEDDYRLATGVSE
ncbi:6-hydroxynicotinate 3-monooxygenase [Aspergillus udagawae]|uniref:6-hydroxynicotinate 3-monooxygenase n=1 Tax=Aspergillus udagawae TaxID=91492 RepID=A0ABQ1B8D4_9EURO|nr:6-hydroxynicotinate 3-monooxygenase [Aspergillus udagawae]GFG27671.1 6-hydroxynicotinate 3-monooxygenase [Aspergillus udagawae]